jgi:hypothetical protein
MTDFERSQSEWGPVTNSRNTGFDHPGPVRGDPDTTIPKWFDTPMGNRIEVHEEVLRLENLAAQTAKLQAIDHDILAARDQMWILNEHVNELCRVREEVRREVLKGRQWLADAAKVPTEPT